MPNLPVYLSDEDYIKVKVMTKRMGFTNKNGKPVHSKLVQEALKEYFENHS